MEQVITRDWVAKEDFGDARCEEWSNVLEFPLDHFITGAKSREGRKGMMLSRMIQQLLYTSRCDPLGMTGNKKSFTNLECDASALAVSGLKDHALIVLLT